MTTTAAPVTNLTRHHLWLNIGVVAALHVAAVTLIATGATLGGLTLGVAAFAYTRGLLHALDADHLVMIDASSRKLIGENQNPNLIGLAFSLGHSSVVIAAGVAVIAGAQWVRTAINPDTTLAATLGSIGATVSALYLLAVAAANVPLLIRAIRNDPTTPHTHNRGVMARLLTKPLQRVRGAHPIFLFGVLFGLGFDTASTIAVLMVTAAAGLDGAPTITLLGLPLAFAAAMTLGDSINATIMLRVYTRANAPARRRLNITLLTISIAAAVAVATVTASELLSEWGNVTVLPPIDTTIWGWIMAGGALAGGLWLLRTRARHNT